MKYFFIFCVLLPLYSLSNQHSDDIRIKILAQHIIDLEQSFVHYTDSLNTLENSLGPRRLKKIKDNKRQLNNRNHVARENMTRYLSAKDSLQKAIVWNRRLFDVFHTYGYNKFPNENITYSSDLGLLFFNKPIMDSVVLVEETTYRDSLVVIKENYYYKSSKYLSVEYYLTGEKKTQTGWKNNKRHGNFVWYNKNERVIESAIYSNGERVPQTHKEDDVFINDNNTIDHSTNHADDDTVINTNTDQKTVFFLILCLFFLFVVFLSNTGVKQKKSAKRINRKINKLIVNAICKAVNSVEDYKNRFLFDESKGQTYDFYKYSMLEGQKAGWDSVYNMLSSKILDKQLHSNDFYQKVVRENPALFQKNINIKSVIDDFIYYYNNLSKTRDLFNKAYLKFHKKINKDYFNSINKFPLTEEQKVAIIVDDDFNLINAGAGTGKTATLLAKVRYLVDIKKCNPDEILILAYNADVSKEIQEKLKKIIKNCRPKKMAQTFHAFGRSLIDDKKLKLSKMEESESLFNSFINKSVLDFLEKDDKFFNEFKLFFDHFLIRKKSYDEFKNYNEYHNYCVNNAIITFKDVEGVEGEKEQVKSLQERNIANFLFINNINYQYERQVEIPNDYPQIDSSKSRIYAPDFYLPDYDIYIEHYALKKHNESHFGQDYLDGVKWKREFHSYYNHNYIETYSFEANNGVLENNLRKKLKAQNVVFSPMSKKEILDVIRAEVPKYLKDLSKLFKIFIQFVKADDLKINDLKKNNSNKRDLTFLNLFEPIFKAYQNSLHKSKEIDYCDQLGLAISSKKIFQKKYKYILVDEFQDIGSDRYRLLKKLAFINKTASITCVGDDWQSIYGFSGAQIDYMFNFNNHFNTVAFKVPLSKTFRFSNQMADLTNRFIMKNPLQIKKNIKSNKLNDDFIEMKKYNYRIDCIKDLLDSIPKNETVMILNRYNEKPKNFFIEQGLINNKGIGLGEYKNLIFKSTHSSKGLEADYVILDRVSDGGFPSEKKDDPILKMVKISKEDTPFAEERRLFYVALTRAKKKVYVFWDEWQEKGWKESVFVKEIRDIQSQILRDHLIDD